MNRSRNAAVTITLTLLVVLAAVPWAHATEIVKEFSGRKNDYNLSFSVNGAWELHWEVEGDPNFPSISHFEVHLHDAATERFLGVVGQKTGSGHGIRYFNDGGRFYFVVLAHNGRWNVKVMNVHD